jgi:hypothetical protein
VGLWHTRISAVIAVRHRPPKVVIAEQMLDYNKQSITGISEQRQPHNDMRNPVVAGDTIFLNGPDHNSGSRFC